MGYRFRFTENFDRQLDEYLDYLLYQLGDPMVARNLLRQVDEAVKRLASSAHSYALCEDDALRNKGVRKIHLSRYNYKIFYHIKDKTVIVDAICHDLRDYISLVDVKY